MACIDPTNQQHQMTCTTLLHCNIVFLEHGDYLALDLGGTNFRVIYVEMRNGVRTKTMPHYYVIPDK